MNQVAAIVGDKDEGVLSRFRDAVAEDLRALALLHDKEPDREILALRHVEELSNRECAHVLDLSDAGASRRYLRAAKKLGAAFKERGLDE